MILVLQKKQGILVLASVLADIYRVISVICTSVKFDIDASPVLETFLLTAVASNTDSDIGTKCIETKNIFNKMKENIGKLKPKKYVNKVGMLT